MRLHRLRPAGAGTCGAGFGVVLPALQTGVLKRSLLRPNPCMRSSAASGDELSSSSNSMPVPGDGANRQQPMGFVSTPVGDPRMLRPVLPGVGPTWPAGSASYVSTPGSSGMPGGELVRSQQAPGGAPSSSGRGVSATGPGGSADDIPPIGVPASSSYSQLYKMQNASIGVSVGTQTDEPSTTSPDGPANGSGINGEITGATNGGTTTTTNGGQGPGSVAEALARAQEALNRAESSLDDIEKLPSATPPKPLPTALLLVRNTVLVGAVSVALVASHAFGLAVQLSSALLGSLAIAWWGLTRQSLDRSGAMAALLVGTGTLGCSLRLGATLLTFFFSASKLTHYKEELKVGLDVAARKGGQRDWRQVFCNGAVPTALAIAYGIVAGCVDVPLGPSAHLEPWRAKLTTALCGGFLGYYACCCGDTWASELGPLSADTPRLITTLRPVRRGTNGGVTLLGLSASVAGGALIGAVFYAAALVSPTLCIFEAQHAAAIAQWRLIPLGLMAGLTGSVLDSLLGATLQYTGYQQSTGKVTSEPGPDVVHISGLPFLDNNMVNMVSASLTSALTALAAVRMFSV